MEVEVFTILLRPFIIRLQEIEEIRASRARKNKRVKKIGDHFPSVNTMYPINRRTARKYLSPEGRAYKDYIQEELDKSLSASSRSLQWELYDCTYVFYMTHEMLFTKDGNFAQHDVSNFLKATEDAVFDWLLESDAQVLGVHGFKKLTVDEPKLVGLISPSSEGAPIYHQGVTIDPYELETDAGSIQTKIRS